MALQYGIDQQNPQYDQQGMLIPGTGGLPAGGWAALPQVAPTQTQTPQPQPQPQQATNPVDTFNTALIDLLKRGQNVDTSALYNERNKLGVDQITNSMAPASQLGIDNLRPGDALNARQNAGKLYNPEINNLTDRIQASAEAVKNFQSAIDAAKSFGESYAKTVQVDDATVQAVKTQMAAGFLPSADVISKVGKYLTADDWNALAKAKTSSGSSNDPTSYQEYVHTTDNPTPGGYAAWLDRQSQYKAGSGSGSSGGTVTERILSTQSSIVNSAIKTLQSQKSSSDNHYANPETWLDSLSTYVTSNGNPADFLAAVPPERYLSSNDAAYVISIAKRQSSSSNNTLQSIIGNAIAGG